MAIDRHDCWGPLPQRLSHLAWAMRTAWATAIVVGVAVEWAPAAAVSSPTPVAASPATPAPDAPAKPVAATPATPAPDAPAKPVAATPATPAPDAPAKPVAATPATPAPDATANPVAATPATPAPDSPAKPVAATPATPAPDAPANPVAATPATPAPDSPAQTTVDVAAIKAARRAAAVSAAIRRYPIPPKIQRYVERLLRQYDTNGDGVLQPEEFALMQGDPKLIDINRDGVITIDDLAFYVTRYGLLHRIHLAVTPQSGASLLTGMAPTVNGFPVEEPGAGGAIPLEAAYAADGEMSDEDQSQDGETAAYRLEPRTLATRDATSATGKRLRPVSPWTQKFHVSPRSLPAGLPDWFRVRDLDGDGQITLREFAPEATRKDIEDFVRYDTDRDGIITPAEAARLGGRSSAAAAVGTAAARTSAAGTSRMPGGVATPLGTIKKRP